MTSSELNLIAEARHHDPFAVLGRHLTAQGELIRAYLPGASAATIVDGDLPLNRANGSDFFEWRGQPGVIPDHYRLHWQTSEGNAFTAYDPYCFPPQIPEFDLHLFSEGKHWHAYKFLGAHPWTVDGIEGVLFATWAPNAGRVSVVGDFNRWDGRTHPMRTRGDSGIWELFIPDLRPGTLYKFELRNRDSGHIYLKADPYGQHFELRPSTASIVCCNDTYKWNDAHWLERRRHADWQRQPVSIYEVHLGSWQRDEHGHFLNYRELARRLADYVKPLGFTHIELLPITEHPLDASWGYQTIGNYAATSRFGTPDDLRFLIDCLHQQDIGVFLDWVPGHFPKDPHGLVRYDGSALYEHEDPRLGEHRDWGTLIYNYGRNEVRNYLLASAVFWLEEYHIDGLRVDAVASMLYLDYSRQPGDWIPNIYGGNENLDAIAFLRQLNEVTHGQFPGTMIMAEESTSWPMVSRPTWLGGLGFSMKWNMGWMHDTLAYMSKDPIHRHYHHDMLTFGMLYSFTENFVLPFSHDEVVHGKRSLLHRMPGDEWQRFANLRLLYTYMFTYPGKKLLFMGCEFGQGNEWNSAAPLDWYVLEYPFHQGIQRLVGDLNRLYRAAPALHCHEFEPQGFEWIDCHDAPQSILSYLRRSGDQIAVIAMNFTPIPRQHYRLGVPHPGLYREAINSDSSYYAGSNLGNAGTVQAEAIPWMGRPYSISITLPPLAGVVFLPAAG